MDTAQIQQAIKRNNSSCQGFRGNIGKHSVTMGLRGKVLQKLMAVFPVHVLYINEHGHATSIVGLRHTQNSRK